MVSCISTRASLRRRLTCFNGDVLTKSGVEFAQALDNLRTALAAYVDHE